MINTISFPGLGIGPLKIAETVSIFGFDIHWYGVIIAIGIILAYAFGMKISKEHGLTRDNISDILIFGLPSALICARIYYVIFEWSDYRDNLLDIFKIWNGGIAIYGAVIGACISTFIYCKNKKINVMKAFDVGAFGLLIGQICGRWGNFVNAEAFGAVTTLPWGMQIDEISKTLMFHPTFLYESLWNLCVFIILTFRRKKRTFDGEMFLSYVTLYGLGRFWIEGLRTDSLYLGPVRISQLIAAICVIVGTALIIVLKRKGKMRVD